MNLAFEAFKYFCEGETEVLVDLQAQKVGVKSDSPVLNVFMAIGVVVGVVVFAKYAMK